MSDTSLPLPPPRTGGRHNTATRYGAVAKFFHWSIALGIVIMIPLGIVSAQLPYDTAEALARKAMLFSVHKTFGIVLFALALARILWALTQPKPVPLHPDRKAETLTAEIVHWLLYGSLVLVPLSGWIHHAATDGFAPIWWPFGQSLPFVPKDTGLADLAGGAHIVFERVLALSLLLHVLGALKHHWLDRDDTLRRMWFGRTEAGTDRPHAKARLAPIAALVTWGAAIGIGGAIGVFSHGSQAGAVAELAQVESDWQVQDGTLGLSIRQFGQEVTGSFDSWTADITFDDSPGEGPKGAVQVQIAIGSVTLGSVTAQALGPDYFDVERFATAVFAAPLVKTAAGYLAEGVLTLRGVEVPVSLPFDLVIDGPRADMSGTLTLDRRTFGIGDNMTDPGQLGFDVEINVSLTALRSEG